MPARLRLVRVECPRFVAGVLVDQQDRIVQAAPILHWSRGKTVQQLARWVLGKGRGWRIDVIDE